MSGLCEGLLVPFDEDQCNLQQTFFSELKRAYSEETPYNSDPVTILSWVTVRRQAICLDIYGPYRLSGSLADGAVWGEFPVG